jgi:hypothetical protein
MHDSAIVSEYLDRLAAELRFDARLSHRARKEIENHLLEAAADQPAGDWREAQQRAVARFGDPREIARQYAASSVFAQTRRLGFIAILALAGIYVAMKGRFLWYGLMQWEMSGQVRELATTWMSVAVFVFRVALVMGVIGLVLIASRRAPLSFNQGYRRQVRHCVVLCTATAGALLGSVVMDTVFTGLRLSEVRLSAAVLVPALSVGLEIALLSMLALHIRATIRRTAFASSLLSG